MGGDPLLSGSVRTGMFRSHQIGRIAGIGRRPLVNLVHRRLCARGKTASENLRTIFAYVAIVRGDLLWLMCILQFIYFRNAHPDPGAAPRRSGARERAPERDAEIRYLSDS